MPFTLVFPTTWPEQSMKLVPNECLLSDQVVRQAVCGAYHLPLSLLNGDSKEAKELHFPTDLKLSEHRP